MSEPKKAKLIIHSLESASDFEFIVIHEEWEPGGRLTVLKLAQGGSLFIPEKVLESALFTYKVIE